MTAANATLLVIGDHELALTTTGEHQWLEITVRDGYDMVTHWLSDKNAERLRDALTAYLEAKKP